jgi:hypothetical protein
MMPHVLTIQTRAHARWRFSWTCSCERWANRSRTWSATRGIAEGSWRKHVLQTTRTRIVRLASGPRIEEHW